MHLPCGQGKGIATTVKGVMPDWVLIGFLILNMFLGEEKGLRMLFFGPFP